MGRQIANVSETEEISYFDIFKDLEDDDMVQVKAGDLKEFLRLVSSSAINPALSLQVVSDRRTVPDRPRQRAPTPERVERAAPAHPTARSESAHAARTESEPATGKQESLEDDIARLSGNGGSARQRRFPRAR